MHMLAQWQSDLQNTTVFEAVERFSSNSFASHSHNLGMLGQGWTESFMFGLSGGKPMMAGFCIDVREITHFRVSWVTVAVNARILTSLGNKLLILPSSAKAFRNSSPLER